MALLLDPCETPAGSCLRRRADSAYSGFGVEDPSAHYAGERYRPRVPIFSRDFSARSIGADGTFTRASTAYHKQPDGQYLLCLSGEQRFSGALRYNNFLREFTNSSWVASSDDLTLGYKTNCTASFASGITTITSSSATSSHIRPYQNSASVQHPSLYRNRSCRITFKVRGVGTGIGKHIAIGCAGTSDHVGAQVTADLTANWVRVSSLVTWGATFATNAYIAIILAGTGANVPSGGVIEVCEFSIVDVTGMTNKNPPMHVSSGLGEMPNGVDGVKYFTYANGNTVDGNGTVTDAEGANLAGPFGLLLEHAATNRRTAWDGVNWNNSSGSTWGTAAGMSAYGLAYQLGIPSTSSAIHQLSAGVMSLAATGTHWTSVLCKPAGYNYVAVTINDGVYSATRASGVVVDLTTGQLVGSLYKAYLNFRSTQQPDGAWLIEVEFPALTLASTYYVLHPLPTSSQDPRGNWSGDGVSGLYICGAQLLDPGEVLGTPIASMASASTRAVDALSYSGVSTDNETRFVIDGANVDSNDWNASVPTPTFPQVLSKISVYAPGERMA